MEEFPQESKSCEMERQKLTLQISDVAPLTLGDQRPSVALCRMVRRGSHGVPSVAVTLMSDGFQSVAPGQRVPI